MKIVKGRPGPYDIAVGAGIMSRLPALLSRRFPARRAVLVSDSYLLKGPAGFLARHLRAAGWTLDVYALPRGEAAKSLSALNVLHSFLLRRRVERRTPLIAVGGGSVGDAAGFAAATYYRGIPLVHVPTTLLAQVDSAIGGKTAVNHPLGKNAIGAFHQPALVAADVSLLKSLSKREFMSGMAEVVKYALLFDPAMMGRLNGEWDRVLAREPAVLARLVAECAAWKSRVVGVDERDLSGKRELLNFGHTIGHALETETGYRFFRHGEAVAWGMLAAAALSIGRGWMKGPLRSAAMHLISRLDPPAWPKGLKRARVLSALSVDKKVRGGKNVFILLKNPGFPVRVDDVSRAELNDALEVIGS